MLDRLAELRGGDGGDVAEVQIDLEAGPKEKNAKPRPPSPTKRNGSPFMNSFFEDVGDVKHLISEIKDACAKITRLDDEAIMASTTEQEKEVSAELSRVISETNIKASKAKGLLEKIKKETERQKKSPNAESSEIRIRENLSVTLTRKFVETMKEYQKCQMKYKTGIKKKVKRQVQYVKPDATSEEIDQVLRTGDTGQLYKAAILKNNSADAVQNAFLSCQEKYQDVLRLEQSVMELHQMFVDLALLVEQQGEMLDKIEFQVQSASEYIAKGNQELVKAIKYQKSARKKKCCLLVTGLIIVAVFVGVGTGF